MAKFFNSGIEKIVYEPPVTESHRHRTLGNRLHQPRLEHERRLCAPETNWNRLYISSRLFLGAFRRVRGCFIKCANGLGQPRSGELNCLCS